MMIFKALIEIIAKSFGTQNLRCNRAAFWLATLVACVVGIAAAAITAIVIIYNPTLMGLLQLVMIFVFLAGIWLTILTARRIRDAGYRADLFYLYAIIAFVLAFLMQFGNLEIDEGLAFIVGLVEIIINFWILIICLKPTSPTAEERFGAAIAYSFDMEEFLLRLKKFTAFGIVFGLSSVVIIGLIVFVKTAIIDKKDGCYLSQNGKTHYLGELKSFNKDVTKNFILHFKPEKPYILKDYASDLPQPQYLAPIDFKNLIPNRILDKLDETQDMELQCYEDKRQYLSLTLKDFLIDGMVTLDTDYLSDKPHEKLLVNFEHGKIKDSEIVLGYNGFQEQRFYTDGVISKIIYTASPDEEDWETFEANYQNGKLHGEIEILTKKGRLILPYEHGLSYGVERLYDLKNVLQKQCFRFRGSCSSRVEYHSKNGKTHTKYYDRENNPISQEQVEKKSLKFDIALNFEDSVLQTAYESHYRDEHDVTLFEKGRALIFISSSYDTLFFYPNGVESFSWSTGLGKGRVNELDYNRETREPSILQSYYDAFMTLPLDSIQSTQIDDRILYMPKTKQELLTLVRNEKINLADIDTKQMTDMCKLFSSYYTRRGDQTIIESLIDNFTAGKRQDFSGIETWDTSNVVNMERMFENAVNFNQNIGSWNVSKVENMKYMFWGAESFDQNLDSWDTSKVKNMFGMFYYSPLSDNPPKWSKKDSGKETNDF